MRLPLTRLTEHRQGWLSLGLMEVFSYPRSQKLWMLSDSLRENRTRNLNENRLVGRKCCFVYR